MNSKKKQFITFNVKYLAGKKNLNEYCKMSYKFRTYFPV